jgi:hypothetical protein
MEKDVESFYERIKDVYSQIVRIRGKTISTQEFKENIFSLYQNWKTEIEPMLRESEIDDATLSTLDSLFEYIYTYARSRVAYVSVVKKRLSEINDIFLSKIFMVLKKGKEHRPYIDLVKSVSFLGLDTNWFSATCALQLQEVAITLVAKKKNIKLDKKHVEKILDKKIDYLSFNEQYKAFSKEIKRLYDVDMPFLTTQFRKIRVKILHEGYNPEPEEKGSIVTFTLGLLQKLKDISDKEPLESEH